MNLKNKVAIVTGAGSGIGKDIALGLSKNGCHVVLIGRRKNLLEDVANQIIHQGNEVLCLSVDLEEMDSVSKIINETLKRFSTIDILINNAAVLYATPFDEVTENEWDQVININLKAAFFLSQESFKIMKKKSSGYIINIASTAAIKVPAAIPTYGISKVGLIGMSQALYETGKEFGVKVSYINPGMTDTEMLRGFDPPVDSAKWMLPVDITESILFLLKQSSRVVIKEITPWAVKHDQI